MHLSLADGPCRLEDLVDVAREADKVRNYKLVSQGPSDQNDIFIN